MTQIQQPEALRLAAICETKGMFPVADELNRMHTRILELEQGKCLHQIAEPAAAPQSALVEALRAVCTDMVAVGNGQHAITDAARDKVEALQGLLFSEAPQAVQPAVPVDMQLVPAEFVRGFGDLAHNYSLAAVAPDYYYGVERDAFSAAYKRCGNDLAKLREILTAAPAHPAEGVPAQNVQITLTGYQLLAALRLANPSLDFAPMELLTDIVLSETPLVDFDGAQLHEGPIAWVDGVNESAIALEAEPENGLHAATQPAAQGLDERSQFEAEYERLFAWRARWMLLACKSEHGRLQSRQERIERKAVVSNNKIRALMKSYDKRAAQAKQGGA